jgi:hypothetical protein
MKATLTFDLLDEKDELLTALHAGRYAATLHLLDTELRARLKYCENGDVDELVRFLQGLRGLMSSELKDTNWRD